MLHIPIVYRLPAEFQGRPKFGQRKDYTLLHKLRETQSIPIDDRAVTVAALQAEVHTQH